MMGQQYGGQVQRGVPGDQADWSDLQSISRPVREYLAALDQSELEKSTPKNISLTDPAAQWSAAWGPAFYAYSANYLIDIAAGIVVDVEATLAHKTDEIDATKTIIERVEERFDLKPDRLIGDTNYGTAVRSRSNRMCRCWTGPNARTKRYPAVTSSGMNRPTNTAVHRGSRYGANGGSTSARERASPRPTPSFITPAKPLAASAR
jgi:hypothetical protein